MIYSLLIHKSTYKLIFIFYHVCLGFAVDLHVIFCSFSWVVLVNYSRKLFSLPSEKVTNTDTLLTLRSEA